MATMSYLAYPTELGKKVLCDELQKINGCTVDVSENEEVLILITETNCQKEEDELQLTLKSVKSLNCLTLVYAHSENETL